METDATVEFIELYNRLEAAIRDKYDVPRETGAVSWLVRNERGFGGVRDELNYCREIRNFLQHNERVEGEYAVIPSKAMIRSLKSTIARVEGMPRAIDLCVRTSDLCSTRLDDRMLPVLRVMNQKAYSHVPILNDGRVVGVFSLNALLAHILEEGAVQVDEDATFRTVAELLPLEGHAAQKYAFVAQGRLATDVAGLFQDALRNSQRLCAVFVTAHGKPTERLLGMLTSWDMAAFF